ncbi:MAG: hypothetical protein KC561_13490, partial [Myxococcales bacterium]|nr:hypothetical protein [Myxococcales bacterium]
VVLSDLLLTADSRFSVVDSAEPLWAVALDPRGLPRVRRGPNGNLSPLFRDRNGDTWADIDEEGQFLGPQQVPFRLAPYGAAGDRFNLEELDELINRDQLGRAIDRSGQRIFDYVDLNSTVLGFVLRRVPDLIERQVLVDTVDGLEGMLGELDRTGDYPHYTDNTPILDLVHAGMVLLDFDQTPELLDLVAYLLDGHSDALATLMLEIDESSARTEGVGAELTSDSTLMDDLLAHIFELAKEKGLLDEILTALRDPVTNEALRALAELNTYYNDAVRPALDGIYNQQAASCFEAYDIGTIERVQCLRQTDRSEILAGLVDHSAPEGPGNTSLGQRVMHLVHDGTYQRFDMVVSEATLFGSDISSLIDVGPLLTIEDVATAFFDSIAGNFCLYDAVNEDTLENNALVSGLFDLLDTLNVEAAEDEKQLVVELVVTLSDSLGVHLDECPTPGQMLRFFNLPEYRMELGPAVVRLENGTCSAGFPFQEHHADTLYAAEATGLVDGLYPLVKVLSDRGLTYRLSEIVHDLYQHYPAEDAVELNYDGTPQPLIRSNFRSYEPILVDLFEDEGFLDSLDELVGLIQDAPFDDQPQLKAGDLLQEFLFHTLDPEAEVSTRDGVTTAERGDGTLTDMSRFYLLDDAISRVDLWLDGSPATQEAWDRSAEALTDLLLETEWGDDNVGRFVDPGSPALAAALVRHAARYLRRHRFIGDLSEKLLVDYPQAVE